MFFLLDIDRWLLTATLMASSSHMIGGLVDAKSFSHHGDDGLAIILTAAYGNTTGTENEDELSLVSGSADELPQHIHYL